MNRWEMSHSSLSTDRSMSHKVRTGRISFRWRQKMPNSSPLRDTGLTNLVPPLTARTQHFLTVPGASRARLWLYNVGGISPIRLIKISCLYNTISELKIQRNKGQTALSSSDFPSLLQLFHSVPWFSGTIKTSVSHAYPVPLNSFT